MPPIFRKEGRRQAYPGAALIIPTFLSDTEAQKSRTTSKGAAIQLQQRPASAENPDIWSAAHNRGNIQLAIANNGTFGTFGESIMDPFTGELIPSCTYPRNSFLVYLWVGAFRIGAVVGYDTLVSVGSEDFYEISEFRPEAGASGRFRYDSIDVNSKFYDPGSSLWTYRSRMSIASTLTR